ncbi:GTP 3',8-cyclase MoaA [Denitromonas ohlonensis]|jgi:cyclic pyranopterin phosphate synthase|uniref:GTP 3',8-cyclase n=3 Tax=Denitromonas TaxID=139331 RepID=A0A558E4I7_9RHOO|nr:GTP 3',8-cyclase MoaA [Denitromonas ohlonensis]TVO79399.1 GTP 3',8-cyclase MoaA [Denitromonas ohlonensis]TVT50010.1 MAG: GTP 3',8-cyclase MoaA [Denitromonas halophila]TVT68281.1 MAG: GTP 3',8-cyclase MoaA [Denitromonas halophila]
MNPMSATSIDTAEPFKLTDQRGRPVRDLRISVTDRCNFRCVYCMPRAVFGKDYTFLARSELLSFEEIVRIARIFVANGVRKIRITGGEPLLRRNVDQLIKALAALPEVEVTLTTNGVLLPRMAQKLADAGLRRVTVSLDALDDEIFKKINDADFPVADVLAGIEAARDAGLMPVKVNMVVKRGVNDHQIVDMARHFKGSGHILRFIEFMDVGASNGWRLDDVVPSREVIDRIHAVFPLESSQPNYTGEVAERWRYLDGDGEVGVISSVTQAFCSTCTRIRLSTEGKLYTCLFANEGHELRAPLRGGASDEELAAIIHRTWQARSDRYSEIRTENTHELKRIEMSYIGG